nr:MAG TPA: hypothetical protein [Caudoviricetes sp.]
MPTEREEHSIRLTKPRTFRDSPFAFTDARAAVTFDRFGEVEVTQDVTEDIGFSGGYSSATTYHRSIEERLSLMGDTPPTRAESLVLTEAIGIRDEGVLAPREPIRSLFTEHIGLGRFLVHEQHGHIYMEFTEGIGLSGQILPPLSSLIVESVGLGQDTPVSPSMHAQESLGAGTEITQEMKHALREWLGMRDERGQVFTAHRSFREGVSLREETGKLLMVNTAFTEGISIGTSLLPPLASAFVEDLLLYDGIIRASEATIEGIAAGKEMTFDAFMKRIARPIGYGLFHPFRVGEYEYEKALVRIGITAGSYGAIPQIYNVVMNVDIDDTVDRGTAQVDAKETAIFYHKHYYTKPEVTVTLQSGNAEDGVLTPEITSIGTESFTCVLRRRDGAAAKGRVSWTAVGY